MNVVDNTVTWPAHIPAEPQGKWSSAGAVPAGVLAGFGDLLLLLLGTAGLAQPTPACGGSREEAVETVPLVALGVRQAPPGEPSRAQAVPTGGAVSAELASRAVLFGVSAAKVDAAGVDEAGGDRPPVAAAVSEASAHDAGDVSSDSDSKPVDGWRAPVGSEKAFSGSGVAESGSGENLEALTSHKPAVSDWRLGPERPGVQAGIGEAEAAADATSGVEAGRVSSDPSESPAASPTTSGDRAKPVEQSIEPEAAGMARETDPSGGAGKEPGERTVREVRRPGGEDAVAVERASGSKPKKGEIRDSAGRSEPGAGVVHRVDEPPGPAAEARAVAAGKDAAPKVGQDGGGGRDARAVRTADIAREIVQQARVLKYPEKTEVEIRLKPEWMGRVTLRVSSQEGRVSARFIVAESAVRAEIESRLGELRHDMVEQGLSIGEISVSLDGGRQATGHGGWTPEGGEQGPGWTTGSRLPIEAAPDAAGPFEGSAYLRQTATLDVIA